MRLETQRRLLRSERCAAHALARCTTKLLRVCSHGKLRASPHQLGQHQRSSYANCDCGKVPIGWRAVDHESPNGLPHGRFSCGASAAAGRTRSGRRGCGCTLRYAAGCLAPRVSRAMAVSTFVGPRAVLARLHAVVRGGLRNTMHNGDSAKRSATGRSDATRRPRGTGQNSGTPMPRERYPLARRPAARRSARAWRCVRAPGRDSGYPV